MCRPPLVAAQRSVPPTLRHGTRSVPTTLEVHAMDIEFLLGGVLTLLLTVYLVYALVRPENF